MEQEEKTRVGEKESGRRWRLGREGRGDGEKDKGGCDI